LEALPLEECPHLTPEVLAAMQSKLEEGREAGEGRRPSSAEQALRSLLSTMPDVDMEVQAAKCGGKYDAGGGRSVTIDLFEGSYRVTVDDVEVVHGESPTVWVKILLLIYLTRAGGRPQTGAWRAYRDLPNSVSKAKSFEACAARIASRFEGDPEGLDEAVRRLGGKPTDSGSADRAFVLRALPRVPLMMLFWDKEDEFPARVSLLLDGSVLDYLDLEALLFVGEVLTGRLLGEALADVVA
jgi:hypothetical protein